MKYIYLTAFIGLTFAVAFLVAGYIVFNYAAGLQ